MEVGLIATGLHGTLLRSDATLSSGSVGALRQAAAAGMRVVVTTARPARSALAFAREIGVVDFLLSSNGAVVWDVAGRRAVRTVSMPARATGLLIDELACRCPAAAWAVDRPNDRLVSPGWPDLPAGEVRLVDRLPLGAEVLCLTVAGAPMPLCRQLAEQRGVECTSSGGGLVEFSAPGVDKGSALRWVLHEWGYRTLQVLAYGDGQDDLPLLASAARSVAVGNAVDEVLRAADEVTATNDDDGVARHLAAWLPTASPTPGENLPRLPGNGT